MSLITTLLSTAIGAIPKDATRGVGTLGSIIKSVARYPIKALATFFMAPILALRVASLAKNPIRRVIAAVGLLLSVLFAWLAGTFLGSLVGAVFVLSHFGPLMAFGFLVGSTLSVVLSAAFSIFVLNATSWLFLHMSSEDVVEHLRTTSQ